MDSQTPHIPSPLLGHLMSLSCGTLQYLTLLKVSAKLLRSCSREVTAAAASCPSGFPPSCAPAILAAPLWAFSTCCTLLITFPRVVTQNGSVLLTTTWPTLLNYSVKVIDEVLGRPAPKLGAAAAQSTQVRTETHVLLRWYLLLHILGISQEYPKANSGSHLPSS